MSDDMYAKGARRWSQQRSAKENISHEYLEKPAMDRALPDVTGKRVLCIGCGSGQECAQMHARGAKQVTGIDASSALIEIARRVSPMTDFHVQRMEDLAVPAHSFDVAYSSLTLHYAASWIGILQRVRTALAPHGTFIFSTHHPIKWGMEKSRTPEGLRYQLSYELRGRDLAHIHGDYLTPRAIHENLLNEIPITYYHRPMSALLGDIIASGFTLIDFIEPLPVESVRAVKKNFYLAHQRIPKFCIFVLRA